MAARSISAQAGPQLAGRHLGGDQADDLRQPLGHQVRQVATPPGPRPVPSAGGPTVTVGGEGRRLQGGQAPGQEGADGTGKDVARPGGGQPGRARHSPPGPDRRASATTVGDPFNNSTAPVCCATARTSAIRSSAGGRPTRRAYSPSWGVSTVAAARPLTMAAATGEAGKGSQAVRVDDRWYRAPYSRRPTVSRAPADHRLRRRAPDRRPGPAPDPAPAPPPLRPSPAAGNRYVTCSPGGKPPPGGAPGTPTRA